MKPITIGKLRGLQQIASPRGTFTALALDHRQNLRKANPAFVDDAELSRFKLDVTSAQDFSDFLFFFGREGAR